MARGDRQRQGQGRTAEERERDRQERARKRALREGTVPPENPEIPPMEVPPPPDGRRAVEGGLDVSARSDVPFAEAQAEPLAPGEPVGQREASAPGAEPVDPGAGAWAESPTDAETDPLANQHASGTSVHGLDPALQAAIQEPDYEPYADPGPVPDEIPFVEGEVGEAHQPDAAYAAGEPHHPDAAYAAGEAHDPDGAYAASETHHADGAYAADEVPARPDAAAQDEAGGPIEAGAGTAPAEPAPIPLAEDPPATQEHPVVAIGAAGPLEALAAHPSDAAGEHVSAWEPAPLAPGGAAQPHGAPVAHPGAHVAHSDAAGVAHSDAPGVAYPDTRSVGAGEPADAGRGHAVVSARDPGARAGARRASRSSGGRVPPPPGVPGRPGGRAPGRRRRTRSSTRLLAVVALVIAAAVVFVLVRSLRHTSTAKPPPAPAVVHVLIPEGLTRLQIAEVAAKAGLKGNYRLASRSSTALSPREYGAPASTHDLEGFLFPATYDEYPGAAVTQLVTDQLTAFKENLPTDIVARSRALHLSVYEVLIVASMVEREARLSADRAKVAGVIYNRLRKGMPLAIDATLYYAIELKKNIPTYTAELTQEELHMSSAYNTRIHAGLPPTPISNPGLASIAAAAHPASVPYLYYVNGADGCGELAFSTTIAEFERKASAYQEAVAANHGKPPVCKHK